MNMHPVAIININIRIITITTMATALFAAFRVQPARGAAFVASSSSLAARQSVVHSESYSSSAFNWQRRLFARTGQPTVGGLGRRLPAQSYSHSHSSRRNVLVCGLSTAAAVSARTNATATATASCSPNNEAITTDEDQATLNENDVVIQQPFDESILETDHYNGVSLHLERLGTGEYDDISMSAADFETALHTALDFWKREGRKGIWIHLNTQQADKVPVAMAAGFSFHMVVAADSVVATLANGTSDDKNNMLVLKKWLPDDSASRLPSGPNHQIGVGCLVLHPDDPTLMLTVQEKTGPAAALGLWKMPTGLSDTAEDIHCAAIRELREETGLEAHFDGILCLRQAHPVGGGGTGRAVSDLFFVCRMCLTDETAVDIEKHMTACPNEIAAMQWMSVQDYCDQERWQTSPVYQELNRSILCASQHTHFHHATLELGLLNQRGTNTLYKSQLAS
jgi:ADP-ribose pyrophosphatase YjhB (NUDIX family)